MIDITTWVEQFLRALDARFAGRTWFAGLQGSYGRGELRKPATSTWSLSWMN